MNYLALVGWSPGGGDELLPLDEMARRFCARRRQPQRRRVRRREARLGEPALSEGSADARGSRRSSLPYLATPASLIHGSSADGPGWLTAILPMATGAVDRLDQVPERLALVFQ